jgi:hypothetical protein
MVAPEPPPAYLPFNRKERFFTGTVLPGIIAGDEFAHLTVFLQLCGLGTVAHLGSVQFLTEYGFAESAWYDKTGLWRAYEGGRDTPDVVVAGPGWLLAVEAKMYARQGHAAIVQQLQAQTRLLRYWAETLDLASEHVRLVALLPAQYAQELPSLGVPVVTWEGILNAYRNYASPYWLAVLEYALNHYDELKSTFEPNDRLTGNEIVEGFLAGRGLPDRAGVENRTVRQDGLNAEHLAG